MLDFTYMGFADLFGTERERKIQNENICFKRDSNSHHASPWQESQRLRPLGQEGLMVISGVILLLDIKWSMYSLYSEMDMWLYLYGIGYGLIPNAKFCKQLLY